MPHLNLAHLSQASSKIAWERFEILESTILGYIALSSQLDTARMSAAAQITLSARNLKRSFGRREVIHEINLELKRGEVLGLLGHNGAGKSTTLQMLGGVISPHAGSIEICGHDLVRQPKLAKGYIGFLAETPPLYRDLSVDAQLSFAARLHSVPAPALAEALALVKQRCGLEGMGNKIIATLSKGYQQRVGLAQAIIHQPEVIILDEPTVGLDPSQIRDTRALIRELGDAHSVILSTHLLSEVENTCDRVEIMHQGRLIYGDSSARMQQYGQQHGFIVTLLTPPALAELQALAGVQKAEQLNEHQFRILHAPHSNPGAALLALAAQRGWQAQQLSPLTTRMEDAFVHITQDQVP